MREMSAIRRVAVAGALVSLCGCGLKPPQQFGAHPYPQDVQLGAQTSPTSVPAPLAKGANIEPGTPGFLVPPIPSAPSTFTPFAFAPPTPHPCPTADPLAPLSDQAAADVQAAPKPGVYHYRQSGSYALKGKPAVAYPPSVDITIGQSYVGRIVAQGQHDPTDTSIYWDQTEKSIAPNGWVDATITYTFRLSHTKGTPPLSQDSGEIDIYAVTVQTANGTDTFQPQGPDPAPIVLLPATGQPSWNDQSVDGLHQETFDDAAGYHGEKDHVDACGKLIDAYRIDLGPLEPATGTGTPTKTQSSFHYETNSTLDYNIDGWYDIATQDGGLVVAEHITETAIDGSWTNDRTLTINSVQPG